MTERDRQIDRQTDRRTDVGVAAKCDSGENDSIVNDTIKVNSQSISDKDKTFDWSKGVSGYLLRT